MTRAAVQSAQRYPLSSILGTESGVRIIRELCLHGGQLSAAELVRRTQMAKSSLTSALGILVQGEAVAAAGTGRTIHYSLNRRHAMASALIKLFEAEELISFQRTLEGLRLAALAVGPGLVALWAFGSVTRENDRSGSHLDLALIVEASENSAVSDAIGAGLAANSEAIGYRPTVSFLDPKMVVELSDRNDPWWERLAENAIVLIGDGPHDMVAALSRRSHKQPDDQDGRRQGCRRSIRGRKPSHCAPVPSRCELIAEGG